MDGKTSAAESGRHGILRFCPAAQQDPAAVHQIFRAFPVQFSVDHDADLFIVFNGRKKRIDGVVTDVMETDLPPVQIRLGRRSAAVFEASFCTV